MNLRDVVLEESVTWLNSSKIKSSQIESPIALRKTQIRTSEKADIFMKVIKIDLAEHHLKVWTDCVPFISLSNLTNHLGLFPYLN